MGQSDRQNTESVMPGATAFHPDFDFRRSLSFLWGASSGRSCYTEAGLDSRATLHTVRARDSPAESKGQSSTSYSHRVVLAKQLRFACAANPRVRFAADGK